MMRSSSSGNRVQPKSQSAPSTFQWRGLLLVHAEQHALALPLEVGEALQVGDGGHVALDRGHLRDRIGHQVVVGHRDERVVDAHHVADASRPEAGGVHDVLGRDIPLLGLDPPLAARERR